MNDDPGHPTNDQGRLFRAALAAELLTWLGIGSIGAFLLSLASIALGASTWAFGALAAIGVGFTVAAVGVCAIRSIRFKQNRLLVGLFLASIGLLLNSCVLSLIASPFSTH